jgi:hypothetical protein
VATTRAELILARHLPTQVAQDRLGIDLMSVSIESIMKLSRWNHKAGDETMVAAITPAVYG